MLTQKRLKELLSYDQDTGIFTWAARTSNRIKIGDIAGIISSCGYAVIGVDGRNYYAHCLSFLYVEGYFPEHDIDHIDGARSNNKWHNLRHVSRACNMQNSKVRKTNTSGYVGVTRNKRDNNWHSRIMIDGKHKSLGNYDSKLDAALARIAAEDCIPDWHCDERCENRKKVFADLRAGS